MMNDVFVREKKSLALLRAWDVENAEFVPDALFAYRPDQDWQPSKALLKEIDFSKPYICLGDSTGLENSFSGVRWDVFNTYTAIIKELKKICLQIVIVDGFNGNKEEINNVIKKNGLGKVGMYNCTYGDLYHFFKNAKIYISGRWHTAIISLMAHTPVLLWGADSHKTEALYGVINYPFRFFDINTLPINAEDVALEVERVLSFPLEKFWDSVEEIKVRAIENVKFLDRY